MNSKTIMCKVNDLKQQLLTIGIAIPGTIQKSYRTCGKTKCRCQLSEQYRHGPYYVWYHRENKKLTTQSIPPEDVRQFEQWIENRERLETIFKQILELAAKYPAALKNEKNNSKKT